MKNSTFRLASSIAAFLAHRESFCFRTTKTNTAARHHIGNTSAPAYLRVRGGRASVEALEMRIAPAVTALALGSLDGINGFDLLGNQNQDRAGHSVSSAGDINGDGYDDLIIGAPGGSLFTAGGSGAAYVVFGHPGGFSSQLKSGQLDGTNGFRIGGTEQIEYFGQGVACAGDVNGDGYDDLIVGGYRLHDPNGDTLGGAAIIFGKPGPFPVNLDVHALDGTNGFLIFGEDKGLGGAGGGQGPRTGWSVAGGADVNGDGFDDVIIGAPSQNVPENVQPGATLAVDGSVYVVYGHGGSYSPEFFLANLDGSNGFRILGHADGSDFGLRVANAGDVNADGFDDVIAGFATLGGFIPAAAVIFGGDTGIPAVVHAGQLTGANGFVIREDANSNVGFGDYAIAGLGDVNGDGLDDIAFGSPKSEGTTGGGKVFVIYGHAGAFAATFDPNTVNGTNGFALVGPPGGIGFNAGLAVAGAGDVNGDGTNDIFFSARELIGGELFGVSHVVFGRPGAVAATVSIASLTDVDALKLVNFDNDILTSSLATAGDLNGDGFADVVAGTEDIGSTPGQNVGAAIVFGRPSHSPVEIINAHKARYTDVDGDIVTITVSKGMLSEANFSAFLRGKGAQLAAITLDGAAFAGSGITVSASPGLLGGNGRAAVGAIEADVDLGRIFIDGDLGRIDAGDTVAKTPGVQALSVLSMGLAGLATQNPETASKLSEVRGSLGQFLVSTALRNIEFRVGDFATGVGNVGSFRTGSIVLGTDIAIAGSLLTGKVGGSFEAGSLSVGINGTRIETRDFSHIDSLVVAGNLDGSRISVAGNLVALTVGGGMNQSSVDALGVSGSTQRGMAVAIGKLTVADDVNDSQIRAGYDLFGRAENGGARIQMVRVGGDWLASDLVAGVTARATHFGTANDKVIAGDWAQHSRIASIIIGGTVSGDALRSGTFGFVASEIVFAKISGIPLALTPGKGNDVVGIKLSPGVLLHEVPAA